MLLNEPEKVHNILQWRLYLNKKPEREKDMLQVHITIIIISIPFSFFFSFGEGGRTIFTRQINPGVNVVDWCIDFTCRYRIHKQTNQPTCIIMVSWLISTSQSTVQKNEKHEMCKKRVKTKTSGYRSFSYTASSVWNCLLRESRPIQSSAAFKIPMKADLFKTLLRLANS